MKELIGWNIPLQSAYRPNGSVRYHLNKAQALFDWLFKEKIHAKQISSKL